MQVPAPAVLMAGQLAVRGCGPVEEVAAGVGDDDDNTVVRVGVPLVGVGLHAYAPHEKQPDEELLYGAVDIAARVLGAGQLLCTQLHGSQDAAHNVLHGGQNGGQMAAVPQVEAPRSDDKRKGSRLV